MADCRRCGTDADDLWAGLCRACRPRAVQRLRVEPRECPACGGRHFVDGPLPWCVSSSSLAPRLHDLTPAPVEVQVLHKPCQCLSVTRVTRMSIFTKVRALAHFAPRPRRGISPLV